MGRNKYRDLNANNFAPDNKKWNKIILGICFESILFTLPLTYSAQVI